MGNNIGKKFSDMLKEALLLASAKIKLAEGKDLTEKEKEEVLQFIYKATKESIKTGKPLCSVKARVAFSTLSLASRMIGEKGKGYYDATKAVTVSSKTNLDNLYKVLTGVTTTAENPVPKNFMTLIAQYEASWSYEELMSNFILAFYNANESYKKDYASPIAPELIEQMEEKRNKILDLNTNYIKK